MAKAFSSVTSEDTKKPKAKSLSKAVTNSSLVFKTKSDSNAKQSNSLEINNANLESELCEKCRRAVDRYSKCSGRFNYNISLPKSSVNLNT